MAKDVKGADLTTCDREPIHLLGRIQSFALLFAFSIDWRCVRVSENIGRFTQRDPDAFLGEDAASFLPADTLETLKVRLQWGQYSGATERLFAQDFFGDGTLYDIAVHAAANEIVVEAELASAQESVEAISLVKTMAGQIRQSKTLGQMMETAARQVRSTTGFDRVMVYQFAKDGTGSVIAESRSRRAESFLGLRYPASDIPKQARALYLKNSFRIIADVHDQGVAVLPELSPEGDHLDLSMAVSRSASPIHLEYLRNMGVGASMSISIVIDGELWGLIACHHMTQRQVSFVKRTAAELFAELFSLELANRLRLQIADEQRRAHLVHERVMSLLSLDKSPHENLRPHIGEFLTLLNGDGVGLWSDGDYVLEGTGLDEHEARDLARFLNRAAGSQIFSTDRLSDIFEPAAVYADRVSGLLAIPVSRAPRDFLFVFRREIAQTVRWGGDPTKPVTKDDDGFRVSPRKSFDAWREVVRFASAPFTQIELQMAESLRVTFMEVIVRTIEHSTAARKRAQAMQDLLISELNHRVRNILSLIQGLTRHTAEGVSSVEEFTSVMGGRIQSLARAHDQLTADNWTEAPLRTLVHNEVDAYAGGDADRVLIEGPAVALLPAAYTCIALVLHELVTNSVKYGALSSSSGSVSIKWHFDDSGDLCLKWKEAGGPPVRAVTRRGFGSEIIERAIPYELEGQAELDYALTGVRAHFMIPQTVATEAGVSESAGASAVQRTSATATRRVEDTSVLFVEDNVIIAMDAEMMLQDLGFAEVLVANTVAAAEAALQSRSFDLAVLDINLGKTTSVGLAKDLVDAGTLVIFASGYSDAQQLPEDLRQIPIMVKPYTQGKITDEIAHLGISAKGSNP